LYGSVIDITDMVAVSTLKPEGAVPELKYVSRIYEKFLP
jgi:hypothetical protein